MKQISWYRCPANATPSFYMQAMRISFLACLLAVFDTSMFSQPAFEETAPLRYRIVFTDKENNGYSLTDPAAFLSERSLQRRERSGVEPDGRDLPVTRAYVEGLAAAGARVITVSKWFNAATISVEADNDSTLQRIGELPFVKNTFQITDGEKSPRKDFAFAGQQTDISSEYSYGSSYAQVALHNGHVLHNQGYTGRNIVIAVIDAGFYHADRLEAFSELNSEGRILGTRDFVMPGFDVYEGHSHGMVVLSIMAGSLPGMLTGTAPEASYWLLRSEDAGSEYRIEEDNWISAAEYADSAGADLINTSLGYSEFSEPAQNYNYSDMDGNTSRISQAADIAASRGMLVVVSAGNLGDNPWHYISAPADGDSVLAVGAADPYGTIATFSSRGPSSDGRVKPDVVAVGKGTYVAHHESGVRQGNGTSLSAPVITGLSACLWQANPGASAMEIRSAILRSADRYANPDDEYGYGIPDFNLANLLLRSSEYFPEGTLQMHMQAIPNPVTQYLYLVFSQPLSGMMELTLYSISGRQVWSTRLQGLTGMQYVKIEEGIADLSKGVYLLRCKLGSTSLQTKLVKF